MAYLLPDFPIKTAIHANRILIAEIPPAPFPQLRVLSINQQALPPFIPPCTSLRLVARAATQTGALLVSAPPGSKPHFMKSQQFCNFAMIRCRHCQGLKNQNHNKKEEAFFSRYIQ
jgi:hypothetical protein